MFYEGNMALPPALNPVKTVAQNTRGLKKISNC